ncbi:MAG: RHS repeat protein [Gammaproteobacteria bacterium]|nr:RHS repeat protein [Gammaproteobacteria bacterium]
MKAIATSTSFGGYWRFSYDRSLDIGSGVIIAVRPNGAVFYYGLSNGIWSSDPDVNASLKQTAAGTWERTDENRFVETYSSSGKLISIADPVGRTQNLTYTNGVLVSITDSAGNALIIGRDTNGRVASNSCQPTSTSISGYDLIGNLKPSRSPQRTAYVSFEDSNGPRRLTGITDEAGIRFATYQYDSVGRAIKSEHAGAAGKVSIDYTMLENPGAPASTVTNSRQDDDISLFNYSRCSKITQWREGHASTNCAAANRLITYDSNGFVESSTDWKGIVTTYVHDARGLETSRTEAVGTSAARTITTEWHPTWRLPTKITEPGRVTEISYYTNGQLKDRTERAVP